MTDGYAAEPAGTLALFHAYLIAHAIQSMPKHQPFDFETVRILLNLTEPQFDEALSLCAHRHLLPLQIVMAVPLKH